MRASFYWIIAGSLFIFLFVRQLDLIAYENEKSKRVEDAAIEEVHVIDYTNVAPVDNTIPAWSISNDTYFERYPHLNPRINKDLALNMMDRYVQLAEGKYAKFIDPKIKPENISFEGDDFAFDKPDDKYKVLNQSECLNCLRNKRIYIFGTSHQRTFYWYFMRRLRKSYALSVEERQIASNGMKIFYGINCSTTAKELLKTNRHLYQGFPSTKYYFLPPDSCFVAFKGCNVGEPSGVLAEKCGIPNNHRYYNKEGNITIHFQFKTYIKSPVVDKILISDLTKEHWDMVFMSACEWGTSVEKIPNTQYLNYSMNFIKSITEVYKGPIFSITDPGYSRSCNAFHEGSLAANEGIVVFNKEILARKGIRVSVYNGHGYEGLIINTFGNIVLDIICKFMFRE